jgi:hypothetical protein
MAKELQSLSEIKTAFVALGCTKVVFKPLANNDNSKQQIYFGGSFDVIQLIPSGETKSDGMSSKGPIFKSPLEFYWISPDEEPQQAKNTQFILYPKYPEVRLSGFLKSCKLAPSHLMKPSTPLERKERENSNRYLFLGINKYKVFAYASSWKSALSAESSSLITSKDTELVTSVFYELVIQKRNSKEKLLAKLKEIYEMGPVQSHRLDKYGNKLEYKAQNGAGYTLEALFGITPNGSPDPDFEDWELKSHSGSVVTLMTPEPNCGTYLDSLKVFVQAYGKVKNDERMDFTGIHKHSERNENTGLILKLVGFNRTNSKITDPDGGLHLIDMEGNLAAGWGFNKLIDHWKNKHSKTCFVEYTKAKATLPKYIFGPKIRLAVGATLPNFLNSLFDKSIYYDPGVNLKFINAKWKPKKRNQFRIKWNNLNLLFEEVIDLDLIDYDEST